ncbi:MAG: hypothetical protein F4Y86_16995 [Gammaproteobacteria bacterium]|nr:hypothetical protein [Gammaproteobacteria bacterium]
MTTQRDFDAFDASTWNESERTYFEIVNGALKAQENLTISNGKPQHAVYLLRTFLANAKRSLRMYSGALARYIDGGHVAAFDNPHVLHAAETMLTRPNATMAVMIEQSLDVEEGGSPDDHPLIRLAKRMKSERRLRGNLEISQATEAVKSALKEADFRHHWMVMDGSAYRLETDPSLARATVNFGDPRSARALDTMFRALWPHGTSVVSIQP